MKNREGKMSFADVVEAVDTLPIEEKIELSELIQKKIIEEQRTILANEIKDANRELIEAKIRPQTIEEIMNDLTYEL